MWRLLIALVVTGSLALTPALGNAVLAANTANLSPATATSPHAMSPHAMSHHGMAQPNDMAECCPDQAKLADKAAGDPDCMAICALIFFLSFAETSVANLVSPLTLADSLPPPTAQTLRAQTGSPPFRPPRA